MADQAAPRVVLATRNTGKIAELSRILDAAGFADGLVGLDAFRRLVNDRRFAHLPMLLETPKGEGKARGPIVADPLDVKNLDTLRSLMAARPARRRAC